MRHEGEQEEVRKNARNLILEYPASVQNDDKSRTVPASSESIVFWLTSAVNEVPGEC